MISPKVVVKTQFNFATNNKSHKTKLSNAMVRGMFNYFSDNEKRAVKMIDYYTGKINKHENINLIIEDGSYATDDELKNRKNRYSKYIKNSNLWQVIVSFNNEHIDSSIKLEDLEQLMIKKIIPDFIRDCRFEDLSKMSYQTSLHSNTDNYHFHFSFIEKSPNSRNSENKLVYRKVGTIPMLAIDNLKRNILLSIDREKVFKPLLIETNEEIQKLKSFFKEDEHNFVLKNKKGLILENKILKLGKLLYN
ncbi:MAG: relaxase MobL, partial [Bacilli bacterium]